MILKPLSGIRILDLTALPPGAFCTLMLADLGAEVVRLESPQEKGKPSRVVGQVALSRAKRSLTLDLRHADSAKVLKRLIGSFDVVVENSKPGSMEARGFGYRQARNENPNIIWCAITGFGQTGPLAQQGGHDLSYLAHSGMLSALRKQLSPLPEIPLALQAAGLVAVVGVQAALWERLKSHEGAFIDISISESASWLLACGIQSLSESPGRIPATADRRLYECLDGRFIAVASCEPKTWGALCDALDMPHLRDALHDSRQSSATEEALARVFKTQALKYWLDKLPVRGATVTAVNQGRQLVEDPQVRTRRSVIELSGNAIPANPVRIAAEAGDTTETRLVEPPIVGEHTDEILRDAGFTSEEISAFSQSGLV